MSVRQWQEVQEVLWTVKGFPQMRAQKTGRNDPCSC